MLGEVITCTLANDEVVRLRPSLRLALWLDRREGGFAKLIRDIEEGSLTTAVEVISHFYPVSNLANLVLYADHDRLRTDLLSFAFALTGISDDDVNEPKKAGKTVTFSEHLTSLYRIGTGWIGWTPAQTLDASPAEIIEAQRGRLDLLKAIFGESEKEVEDDRPLDDKAGDILRGFGTTKEAA